MTIQSAATLAIDANALAQVKRQAKEDPRAATRAAAQQFEALFMQMVLKSMRDAVPAGGMGEGSELKVYQGMLDQQLAQAMAGRGATGLAALIEKQLARALPPQPGDEPLPLAPPQPYTGRPAGLPPAGGAAHRQALPPAAPPAFAVPPGAPAAVADATAAALPAQAPAHAREFVGRIWPHAWEASRETGIPAHFLVAHAALETGWGRGETRTADGQPSHNLFNVKAGRSWRGATAEVMTTEYVDGKPVKQVERFRAYGSDAEAFADYARLLKQRYQEIIGVRDPATFAKKLAGSGYATDPAYADKLTRIIGSATLRASLGG